MKAKGVLLPLLRYQKRLYTVFKTQCRTTSAMQAAITTLYNTLLKCAFKAGTIDRGKEFMRYTDIQKQLCVTLFFVAPYSS